MSDELVLARDQAGSRYTATSGGSLAGLIDYSERPGSIQFLHTETDPAFRGQGIARRLTAYALDDVRERELSLVPLCSYTQRFVTDNPQYADLLAKPGQSS